MNKTIFRNLALGALIVSFIAVGSGVAFAQENQESMNKAQAQLKQDSWESWKKDMKTKYQQVREQADKIKSEAQAKKINDANLKTAIDKFETSTKTFLDKWGTVDQVATDKRDQFKADISVEWDKVKASYDVLKSEWDALNKQ